MDIAIVRAMTVLESWIDEMSVQQYRVRWKEDITVVMFVCQLMDIAVFRAITVLGELN